MGAERVHPSAPNRPVKRTASIHIAAQAAHERAEALGKAVRRHEYAVAMAANNGDVVIANWSGGPRHTRVRVRACRSLRLPPKEDRGNLRMNSVSVVLAYVNRGVSDQAVPR